MRNWGVDCRITEQLRRDEEFLAAEAKKAEQAIAGAAKRCIGCVRSKLGVCKKHAAEQVADAAQDVATVAEKVAEETPQPQS